ncbi:MAG TPA: hypothetical protein VHC98_01050 [Candidatus Saccharimonadales bacterium]|nr:hypothetical protein [Candidatus Saccharimonadales bacterium]
MSAAKSSKKTTVRPKTSSRPASPAPAQSYVTTTAAMPAPTTTTAGRPRRLRLPPYKLFRLQHVKHPVVLPSAWIINRKALRTLWGHRKLFLGLLAIYAILEVLLVTGLSSATDVGSLKQQLSHTFNGTLLGGFGIGVSVFSTLLSSNSTNTANPAAGAYQLILGVIISLAAIWLLREVTSGQAVRLRDSFYKGMYPLIPFVLVMLVLLLQLVPLLIGGGLYALLMNYGIAIHPIERIGAIAIFAILALVSLYMLCSSVFALYIVTLPDMTPLRALRSARQLVRYRRAAVFRKLFFLPIFLLVAGVLISLPFIWLAASLAPWVVLGLSAVGLLVAHAYMYTLYRELLV